MPQLAVSKDFMKAFAALPKAQQNKVRLFTDKFKQDPTQSGINFERIEGAADDKVRSVRIDQAYRAILVHPPRGDVYLLAWVDHHDDAYAWARNRRFEVHPRSGVLQIFSVVEAEAAAGAGEGVVAADGSEHQRFLFGEHDDEELLLAGVPAPLLPAVRAVITEDDLGRLLGHLPEESAEILIHLAAGEDILQAIESVGREEAAAPIDTDDFESALERPSSRRQFVVPASEEELVAMLEAPLLEWRVFLHPSQRAFVTMDAKGPVRILGGAGTGKTVVLLHRARYLARHVWNGEQDRILVTTFTRNLAADLSQQLDVLCGEERRRIEVANLDSWAVGFLRRNGADVAIVKEKEARELLQRAVDEEAHPDLNLPIGFYQDEWEHVIQAQDLGDRDHYLTAARTGRGTPLDRRKRARVWKVLARYRQLLEEGKLLDWNDVAREARLLIAGGASTRGVDAGLRAVLADEVQDFGPPKLRLLRALAPEENNSLFLVGDAHQRIYGRPYPLSRCGIEIRGRAKRLKLNYRTTAQIRARAVSILEGAEIDDLDEGNDTLDGYLSLRQGPLPEVRHFAKAVQEEKAILETLREWIEKDCVDPRSICLCARTRQELDSRYAVMLKEAGIDQVRLDSESSPEDDRVGVRTATLHRLKGLEFERLIVAGIDDESMPLRLNHSGLDEGELVAHDLKERCLLYVATSRARDMLMVTGYGKPSRFLT